MTADVVVRASRLHLPGLEEFSFEAAAGMRLKLVLPSEEHKNGMFACFAGLAAPLAGEFMLFGQSLYMLDEASRIGVFGNVGIVPEYGGLIGNLKIWENILLPAAYHHGRTAADVEPRVVAFYREIDPVQRDLRRLMGKLPDQSTVHERRVAALVRAFLLDPPVMIYDFLLAGIDRAGAARLVTATQKFHAARDGRLSVYLCPDDDAHAGIHADQTMRL